MEDGRLLDLDNTRHFFRLLLPSLRRGQLISIQQFRDIVCLRSGYEHFLSLFLLGHHTETTKMKMPTTWASIWVAFLDAKFH